MAQDQTLTTPEDPRTVTDPAAGTGLEGRRHVSPQLVAQALGVGETTVKRWVDDGRLPARKTPGGHRRILVEDVLAFVDRENLPTGDLSLLTGVPTPPAPARIVDVSALNDRLLQALLAGDSASARAVVLEASQGGLTIARLGDEVIAPTMHRLGHGWAGGTLDVYQEHRGTQACLNALQALKVRLEAPASADRPLAIGGGPEADHYLLANLLIELLLLEQGWRVVNIGPNTPAVSFRRALRELKPHLLWISCSYLADPETFVAGYEPLYAEAERAGVAVAIGGQGLNDAVRDRITFTHHGTRLAHLSAFARSQVAQWRRRGEPRSGDAD